MRSTRATETVRLATDAAEATTSPITAVKPCELPDAFTGCVDYTVFLPRGHYTRSEVLEQYFRAMSLLGQEAFYVDDADSMRMGLLSSRLLDDDPELAAAWSTIYDATAFFVGVADDYTPLEAVSAAASVVPGGIAEAVTADATTILAIGERLLDSRDVGVDPENASVRTMGAWAVLDSFVLDQLAWPNVGTDVDRRTEVSPLDLASVFGSALARQVQTAAGASDYLHYDEQLAAMTDLVQGRDAQDWAGTVYDGWLYALEPQFVPRTAAFPDYMRSDAWAAKSLQTGFGSYTELKHDTILYVKQGTAGEGEDTAPPFEPRHYVEPDPVAFGRIAAIAQLALDGLGARGLLDDAATERFETLVELSSWLAGIAADELAGERTSDMDNERLRGIGFELELLWYETSDIEPFITIPQGDESAALVADIFRSSFDYLELGTGWIDTIYVIVPDGAGGFQLAQGGVYSYYEFWRPVDQQRLTDEEWRGMLLEGSQPERPAWQAPLFADLS